MANYLSGLPSVYAFVYFRIETMVDMVRMNRIRIYHSFNSDSCIWRIKLESRHYQKRGVTPDTTMNVIYSLPWFVTC